MKSLDQIEPRTIVNATNTPGDATNTFIITAPGSYCLTGNLIAEAGKNGISIQADDVTLDLQGFALLGGGVGLRGVDVPAQQTSLHIRHGSVRGWTDGGVRVEAAISVLAERLRLVDNVGATGLDVGNGALVRDCVASGNATGFRSGDRSQFLACVSTINTGVGFQASNYVMLADCTASRNGGNGFDIGGHGSILRCSATRNRNGIQSSATCTIGDCTAGFNAVGGIQAFQSTVTRCTASGNLSFGIDNEYGSVTDSTASGNGAAGIRTLSATGCTALENGGDGIAAGTASGCSALFNGGDGIQGGAVSHCSGGGNARSGIVGASITNCTANFNGSHGISVPASGVAAFCVAGSNNQSNNGSTDIDVFPTKRMLNDPAP